MTTTTYTYETSKGKNVEEFSSNGYVTLYQNGVFKYEQHYSSLMLKFQEDLFLLELKKRNIKYTKTIK